MRGAAPAPRRGSRAAHGPESCRSGDYTCSTIAAAPALCGPVAPQTPSPSSFSCQRDHTPGVAVINSRPACTLGKSRPDGPNQAALRHRNRPLPTPTLLERPSHSPPASMPSGCSAALSNATYPPLLPVTTAAHCGPSSPAPRQQAAAPTCIPNSTTPSTGASSHGSACSMRNGRTNTRSDNGAVSHTEVRGITGGAGVGGALAAALLAMLTPLGGPLPLAVGPAVARIPTEAVLSTGGAAAERTALFQLAAPPAAVVTPAGPPGGAQTGDDDGPAVERGDEAGTSASPAPRPAGRTPGTLVGTPNYYGRGAAGRSAAPARNTANEAAEALRLLASAREAVDGGQHEHALELYARLVAEHSDLALAEYGKIGRAMMLYQVGRTSDSILALEDEEVAMRGAAEVHAALAALLYTERPSLALRAEEEWNLACLFDKRYSDPEWVRANKHWPPRMINALQKFLSLS